MKDLAIYSTTFNSTTRVAVQVYQEVITLLFLFTRVVAAFQGQIPMIFNIKILPKNLMTFDNGAMRSKITIFIEMPGRSNKNICNLLHIA